jgi:hypothetical protein
MSQEEDTYAQATYGYDEPQAMYVYGDTLLELFHKIGDTRTRTNDGRAIVPEGYYEVSPAGIVLVE